MKNLLLVHIGMPKTGSTALQYFWVQNNKKLMEYGWCYPDFYNEFSIEAFRADSGSFINANNLFPNGIFNINFSALEWTEGMKIISEKLEKYNVILSSEAMFEERVTEEIINRLKNTFSDIKVIMYIRRQDMYFESSYNQMVKGAVLHQREREKIEAYIDEFNWQKVNYIKRLKEIERIVGKNNIILRVYEKGQLKGKRADVISDFLDVLKLPEEYFEYDLPLEKRNVRISGNYLEIKRLLNEVWNNDTEGFRDVEKKMQIYSTKKYVNNLGYLNPEHRQTILGKFMSSNEQVAKEYLGREDGRLFYDMDINIPFYESPFEDKDEDIIRVFGTIVSKQDNMIKKLRKQVALLQENYIKLQAKGKKLVYFGAGDKGRECLKKLSLNAGLIIDNSMHKDGTELMGVEVIHSEKIDDWNGLFVVITVWKSEEIEKQLKSYGLVKDQDFVCAKEIFLDLYE